MFSVIGALVFNTFEAIYFIAMVASFLALAVFLFFFQCSSAMSVITRLTVPMRLLAILKEQT